jgi:hypothetical protein
MKSASDVKRPVTSGWTCPRCGRSFVRRNQSHSCGKYTVERFLKGKGANALALWNGFVELVRSCGPVRLAPAKTRIGFQSRTIFAAVNRLGDRGLSAHVVFSRRVEGPRFTRIETVSQNSHVHHFRTESLDELDEEVRGWLCEAYALGSGAPPAAEHTPVS